MYAPRATFIGLDTITWPANCYRHVMDPQQPAVQQGRMSRHVLSAVVLSTDFSHQTPLRLRSRGYPSITLHGSQNPRSMYAGKLSVMPSCRRIDVEE